MRSSPVEVERGTARAGDFERETSDVPSEAWITFLRVPSPSVGTKVRDAVFVECSDGERASGTSPSSSSCLARNRRSERCAMLVGPPLPAGTRAGLREARREGVGLVERSGVGDDAAVACWPGTRR